MSNQELVAVPALSKVEFRLCTPAPPEGGCYDPSAADQRLLVLDPGKKILLCCPKTALTFDADMSKASIFQASV